MKKLLFIFMPLFLSIQVRAYDVEFGGIYYNIITKGNVAEVTSGDNKYSGNVVIPEMISYEGNDYSVSSIGKESFYYCTELTSVIIPNSVISIGSGAFDHCSMLTSIIIPNSVVSISSGAFNGCIGLTSIDIPNSVTSLGYSVFNYCTSLFSIKLPDSITEIEDYTFSYCSSLNTINIPNSVTAIGKNAFQGCKSLTSITIPEKVTTIKYYTFQGCTALTSVSIGGSVIFIEEGAFLNCSGLTSVSIPNSVTSIGYNSFGECTGLTSLIIPNSVKTIGIHAFNGCANLSSISIGSSVNRIDNFAFANCGKLTDVFCYPNIVPSTSVNAFQDSYTEYATLHVPVASISSYQEIAPWKNFKSIVKIDMPKHTLTYVVDGDIYKSYQIEEGTTIIPETAPTKEGYTFSGWSEIPETMPAHDVTVTGSFTINKYKLTYTIDGEEYKSFEVEYGSNITTEPAPTKEGYTFSGWSEIPETMPAHDVTVTGAFSINTYKLTYIVDGQTYKTYDMEYGAAVTPEAAPTKEGYTFSGWSEIPETMPAHDVTVTGTFTKGNYKLTYVVDGELYKTVSYDYLDVITPEPAPTKEGYAFSGWSEIPETMPAHDVTVTGTFTINKYKLTYIVDGQTYKTYDVEYGAAITPEPVPTKEGYTFSGWSEIPETMPAHDVTVTGTFSINKYKLTYTVNGEEYKSYELDYGASITPETAPTKEGYTFSGWSEIPEAMPAHDEIITGSFTINSYKLTYMIDDKVYKESMYEYGATITPEPQPEGDYATFEWIDLPQMMPAHDVVVYASYTSGITEILMTTQHNICIYSPNGKKLDKLQKGLNIVVLDDGAVKKVVVK